GPAPLPFGEPTTFVRSGGYSPEPLLDAVGRASARHPQHLRHAVLLPERFRAVAPSADERRPFRLSPAMPCDGCGMVAEKGYRICAMSTLPRRRSIPVHIGTVVVGGNAPVAVQSMTNTDTADVESTVRQVQDL